MGRREGVSGMIYWVVGREDRGERTADRSEKREDRSEGWDGLGGASSPALAGACLASLAVAGVLTCDILGAWHISDMVKSVN